jgi:hypothetical protein
VLQPLRDAHAAPVLLIIGRPGHIIVIIADTVR